MTDQNQDVTTVETQAAQNAETMPMKVKKGPEYSYTIKDNIGGEIDILTSANAWWKDVAKVRELIAAFKRGYSQRKAALRVGISMRQLGYFLQVHPEFCNKIEDFKEVLKMKLIDKINEAIERGDMQTVRWAAERTMSEKYGSKGKASLTIVPISMREDAENFRAMTAPVSMWEVAKRYQYQPIIENGGQSK